MTVRTRRKGEGLADAVLQLVGFDVLLAVAGAESRFAVAACLPRLRDWSARYDRAAALDREGELLSLGADMFQLLDRDGGLTAWMQLDGDRRLEVGVEGEPTDVQAALLDAPWELLATATGPLVADPLRRFVVARRIGRRRPPTPPAWRDLRLMFMAAAPSGASELDFENEEAAILQATARESRVQLVVEETGALAWMQARLASEEGPFEALHLSCHGNVDDQLGPILLLEDEAGERATCTAAQLIGALPPQRPLLVALSACRTAELGPGVAAPLGGLTRADGSPARAVSPELSASFARQLVTQVAQVLAWDGSVYDSDATAFATRFYAELGRGHAVPEAAAGARRALWQLKQGAPQQGRHWHLARIYLGPQGGGPLCAAAAKSAHSRLPDGERAFLDTERRVPVAPRAAFVGRRRSIQAALRAFTRGRGVLVHGMGALGKSSLAARIASRIKQVPVVIHGRYDTRTLFDACVREIGAEERESWRQRWRDRIAQQPQLLGEALEAMLTGPFEARPMLLVIDDLEQILEPPAPGALLPAVQTEYREVLLAVLQAFACHASESRLLLTSRYDFQLTDARGADATAVLARVHLGPMDARQRIKQWRAAQRLAGQDAALSDDAGALLQHALEAAGGNPGLQATLTQPILAGELDAARAALTQITHYLEHGVPSDEIAALMAAGAAQDAQNALVAFFRRLSFAQYRAALTVAEARQLSAATLFPQGAPIPRAALAAVGAALDVDDPAAAIGRLLGLGLYDDHGLLDAQPHHAANALARPLVPALTAGQTPRLAGVAFAALQSAWADASGAFPEDPRGVVAAELALAGSAPAEQLAAAVYAGAVWLARAAMDEQAALALLRPALMALPTEHRFEAGLLRLVLECAAQRDGALADQVLDLAGRALRAGSATDLAMLDLRRAERLAQTGHPTEAESLVQAAQRTFAAAADERMVAISAGAHADILQARGQLDQALRIRTEEQLPVYARLGDVHSMAITQGKIADILMARGQLDAALRIRTEEQLPVYARLGDVRSTAITQGQIADILMARGQLDDALRIHTEEQLPIYARLGDVRATAITQGQIADILMARGQLDEALRIRTEEQLPVYARLGDVRSTAVTQGKIADILMEIGQAYGRLRI